jgi:hypothetical protein
MTVTAAHEYAEAVTDPYPHHFSNPLSTEQGWRNWYTNPTSEGEISSLCGLFGRGFLPGGIEVPSLWDNSANQCSLGHSNPPQIAPEILTKPATNVTGSKATLHGAVYRHGLEVGTWWYRYGPVGCDTCYQTSHRAWWAHAEEDPAIFEEAITETSFGNKLQPGTTYRYQLVTETDDPSEDGTLGIRHYGAQLEFTTVGKPIVTTSPAEPQYQPAGVATLGGTVNPNGVPAEYFVEFTTEDDFIKNGWANAKSQPVPPEKLVAGSTPIPVTVGLSGLTPETWYEFRLAAKNEAGIGYGNRRTFRTQQTQATTGVASHVGATEARLNGTVNPQGIAASYKFEYGTVIGVYGQSVPVPSEAVGSSIGDVEVSQTAIGLKANTTYHFRIVAENAAGAVIKGNNASFKTGACKGAEGKCEWKAKPTPGLTSSEYGLSGVSCASATMCFGVGNDALTSKGIGELWNGSEWTVPVKTSATKNGSANSVSCPSTTLCMAAGGVEGGSQKTWKLKEEGGKWTPTYETPPTPAGGSKGSLRSVSCTSTTACTAVGTYYVEAEAATELLVERWDGTSWSVQAPLPLVESSSIEEVSVSCASSSFCMMVGTYLKGTTPTSFAERWNGTKWLMSTSQNPGAYATRLESVSCPSISSCIAIGSYKETKSQVEKPLAESWNGTEWSTVSVPSPTEATQATNLQGISCTSASACTAVGSYLNAAAQQKTLAESWDGSKWTVQSSPNTSTTANLLNHVSCTSASACTAVGSADPAAGVTTGELVSLAERWSGTEWKTQSTPNLANSQYSLSEVSCASASMCFAVGSAPMIENGVGELWNGSEWTLQIKPVASKQGYPTGISCPTTTWCMATANLEGGGQRTWKLKDEGGTWTVSYETPALPSGGSSGSLRSVSCTSTSACTAVGYYYSESAGKNVPLVLRWNGSAWSTQSAPSPTEGTAGNAMLSVSCASSTSCTTVGAVNSAPFTEHWNGTSWSIATPALPPNVASSTLESVSCGLAGATTNCVAVGGYKETGKGQYEKPLAERWNGTSWSIIGSLTPSEANGDVVFEGVSCASPVSCTAVGSYSPSASAEPSETRTLAEYWNGSSWTLQASPNSALKLNGLSGVSCSSSIACTAVGSSRPEFLTNEGQVSLAARFE